jgi:3-deoxy-D-manno-octulosonic-acid transferase
MYNFAEATRLALAAGAAVQADGPAGAVRQALELLADERRRAAMAQAGRELCAAHRGATDRQLAVCRRLIEGR